MKSNKHKFENIIFVDKKIEDILAHLESDATEVEKWGRTDGANNIPHHSTTKPSDVEQAIRAKIEGRLRECLKEINLVISNKKEKLKSVQRMCELFAISPQQAVMEILQQGSNPIAQELQAIDEQTEEKTKILSRKKARLELEREKDMTEKNRTEDRIGHRPRKKNFWSYLIYFAIMCLGALADVSVTYQRLEVVAKTSRYASLGLALAVAVALAISAHYFGKSIKIKNRKGIIGSFLGAFMFLGFIAFLAFESTYTNWMMICINIAMFIILSLVSYFFTEEGAELIKKYFKDEAAIVNIESEIDRIDTEIIGIRTNANNRKRRLADDHKKITEQKAEEYRTKYTNEYNVISRDLHEWSELRDNVKDSFTALYEKQVYLYRNLNQAERHDKSIPLVKMWEESKYVEPLRISSENEETVSTPLQPDSNPVLPIDNNGSRSGSNGMLIPLLFFGFLGFTSCSHTDQIFDLEAEVLTLIDETEEQNFDLETATNWLLFDLVGFDTSKVFKSGVSINVSSLNDRYTNRTYTVSLPKSASGFTEVTKERIARQNAFHKEVLDVLRQGFNFIGERPESKLYRPICDAMHQLQKSSAQRKVCVIFSDMFENTKYLSFYDYQNSPGKLLEARNSIIEKLMAQCTLPDLSGIELYIIHQPTLQTDELFDSTRHFWQSYFEEKGATVHFIAGI